MDTREKWDRAARFYDIFTAPMDAMGLEKWRKTLFSTIPEGFILEVGVGTGKNIEFYPEGNREYSGIDISQKMLDRAELKAKKHGKKVDLARMNAENMQLPAGKFNCVVASCVFCSVPDPVKGLEEVRRVLKYDGVVLFLEHMRPQNRMLVRVFNALNPITSGLFGFNINRNTIENIKTAGFEILEERNLLFDIFKFIKARPAR